MGISMQIVVETFVLFCTFGFGVLIGTQMNKKALNAKLDNTEAKLTDALRKLETIDNRVSMKDSAMDKNGGGGGDGNSSSLSGSLEVATKTSANLSDDDDSDDNDDFEDPHTEEVLGRGVGNDDDELGTSPTAILNHEGDDELFPIQATNEAGKKKNSIVINSVDVIEDASEKISKKGLVLRELIESESRYWKHLDIIKVVNNAMKGNEKVIKEKDHNTLFQGSRQLLDLSYNFLNSLKSLLENKEYENNEYDSAQVGSTLNLFIPHFKLYTEYSDSFDTKQAILNKLMGDGRTEFAKHLRSVLEQNNVKIDFQAVLIAPIQRLPRYKLLLERMLEECSKSDPDYKLLEKAVDSISKVANHINKSLQRQMDQLKILQIQSMFVPSVTLVAPGRRLIKFGELDKIHEKNGQRQRYMFFLFNDSLVYGSKLLRGYYRFRRLLTVTGIHDDDEHYDKDTRKPRTYFRRVSDPHFDSVESAQAEAIMAPKFANLSSMWADYDNNVNSSQDDDNIGEGASKAQSSSLGPTVKSNLFSIIAKEKNLTMSALTYEEKQAWVIAIADTIHNRHEKRNSFTNFQM
jgi:hypothetical protein